MPYTKAREIGFSIRRLAEGNQETEQRLMDALGLTLFGLQKLYAGRVSLTEADLQKAADACGVELQGLSDVDREAYDKEVVHCMSPFQNRENREMILDLIFDYIDAREALMKK